MEEKLELIKDTINDIASLLKCYLPITNAHMTDFIVSDWWNKLLTPQIQKDLLNLEQSDLAYLACGSKFSDTGNRDIVKLNKDDNFVVCGDVEQCLKGVRQKWDYSETPKWQHDTLKDFILTCVDRSLPQTKVLTSLHDILALNALDDLVPIIDFMSIKKSHEVEIMTELCTKLAKQQNVEHMIDIGSGKGYLGAHLALKHGIHVLGIDSSSTNTDGATGRSQRLGKQWNGLVARSTQQKEGKKTTTKKERTIHPSNHDLKTTEGKFVPITQFVDKTTNIQEILNKHLHDEISESNSISIDKTTEIENRNDASGPSDGQHSSEEKEVPCASSSTSSTKAIPYMIGGLHACGDLTSNTLRLFLQNTDAKVLCNVGCCYHFLTEGFVVCPFGTTAGLSVEESGFPLSAHLQARGCQLGRNARMMASQAPDRVAAKGKPPSVSLFWRALLQVILRDLTGEIRDDWHVGRIAAKCDSFTQYVHKALGKLGFKDQLSDEEIARYESDYQAHGPRVQCFVQLKGALAPVVEALILLDRMCYLLEQEQIADVHMVQAFDPVTSPRCYALVAWKH